MNQYKYQTLIDEHQLDCKSLKDGHTINSIAFRWVIDPIDHEWNFLPNILYDQAKGSPRRINSVQDNLKCGYCALSLFLSKEAAMEKFSKIPKRSQVLIGYDSIAEGIVTEHDGVVGDLHNEHFNFFEYKDVDLKSRFVIINKI
jgi:hypothetical protein